MKYKHQRLLLIFAALIGLGIATTLILITFQDNIVFFYTPSDITHKQIHPEQRIRLGGLVKLHSVRYEHNKVHFTIMDHKKMLNVTYDGLLPDLFREGQGVVAEGYLLHPHLFRAESVLAKHDEKYMPKEVADRLKQEGLQYGTQ